MKIHNPPMQFKDDVSVEEWNKGLANNQDPYGNAVYRYASEWATLMEAELAANPTLEVKDIADAASHKADTEGITGFMYGCAVSCLSEVWKYGEQLRRWHNLKTQIGTEGEKANESGGVLNPAVLTMKPAVTVFRLIDRQ